MSHIFERYFTKHGHYPRVVVRSGIQKITVTFCVGYISIRASPPYGQEIWITRSAAIQLFKKAVPLLREMAKHPARDHDVPEAMRQAYFDELAILRDKRELKKKRTFDLEGEDRRKRQHQRWLRARDRARRRTSSDGTE